MIELEIFKNKMGFWIWNENFLNRISFLLNRLCASETYVFSTFENTQNFWYLTIISEDMLIFRWGVVIFLMSGW